MAFTSDPQTMSLTAFRQSILAGWIDYIQNGSIKDTTFNPDGAKLQVVPGKLTDKEEKMVLPTIVIQRVQEPIITGRNDNFYNSFIQIKAGSEVETSVYAYRMSATFQFDVLTRNLTDQFTITGYLDELLWGSNYVRDDGTENSADHPPQVKWFILKDITQRTNLQESMADLPDTDVRVYWRPHKGVKVMEMKPFDSDFEQITYRVEFWSDLWYSNDEYTIESIDTEVTIVEEIV